MLNYIIRRILLIIPTLIGVTMVVFFIMALSPGGIGGSVLDEQGALDSEQGRLIEEAKQRRYGLDKPLIVQYLRWLNQVSPIGFRMSADTRYTETEIADAQAILNQIELLEAYQKSRSIELVKSAASYAERDLVSTAELLAEAVDDPEAAAAFGEMIDYSDLDELTRPLRTKTEETEKAAADLVFQRLDTISAVLNRVRWNAPALKLPDFGESMSRSRPVLDLLAEALPVTLLLNFITTPIIYILAVMLGIYTARHRGGFFDISTGVVMLGLWSLPTIMVGVVMIGFLANNDYVYWFPSHGLSSLDAGQMAFLPSWGEAGFEPGWLLDRAWHLVLPVVCLLYGAFAVLMKLMRSSMLENISSDFVRTARAKGVDERTILWGHVFRNSLLPLITVAAGILPSMIGGSVVIEKIFSLPGMGLLMIDAVFAKDMELVMAVTLLGGLLGLFCILLADLAYAVADPRVSYD